MRVYQTVEHDLEHIADVFKQNYAQLQTCTEAGICTIIREQSPRSMNKLKNNAA